MKSKLIASLAAAALLLGTLLPAAQADTTVELVPSSRVILKIIPGMSIDDIIARIYPRDKELWPLIKEKLIEWNPASFHQYSDRLVNGARLKLVDIKRVYKPDLASKTKVGYVARLEGAAWARDLNDKREQLQINSQVFEGDRIETDPESTLVLFLDDGAEVHLKQDSVIKLSEYVITPGYGEDSSSILDLLKGGLRKITGAIGASAVANYQVQTGLATIGIRGTDYVIKLCRHDDCTQTVSRNDNAAKLHAVVLEGAITLTTDDEVQILMAMGEYGTATVEQLLIEEEAPIPVGFLDAGEAEQFSNTVPQKSKDEESSISPWMWAVGILLLAAGL